MFRNIYATESDSALTSVGHPDCMVLKGRAEAQLVFVPHCPSCPLGARRVCGAELALWCVVYEVTGKLLSLTLAKQ